MNVNSISWRDIEQCQTVEDLKKLLPFLSERDVTVNNFMLAFTAHCQVKDRNDVMLVFKTIIRFFPVESMESIQMKVMQQFSKQLLETIPSAAVKKPLKSEGYDLMIQTLQKCYQEFAKIPLPGRVDGLLKEVKSITNKNEKEDLYRSLAQLLNSEYELAEAVLDVVFGFEQEVMQNSRTGKYGNPTPIFEEAQAKVVKLIGTMRPDVKKNARILPFFYTIFSFWGDLRSRQNDGQQLVDFFCKDLKACYKIWLMHRGRTAEIFELIQREIPCENHYKKPLNVARCEAIGLKFKDGKLVS